MRYKFNVGDVVKIKSPYYISSGCIGIISAISYFTIDEEVQYEVLIPETDTLVYINESDLVKIPEKGYSPTTQQIKDDIDSIFGLPMTILLNAKQEVYIDEDIRRTQEMMDTVGKMIHEREERKIAMTPKKIMRNGPATIVFWEDGTKTVVKKMPGDKDDIYAAFCAAFTKKYFGSNEKVKATVDSLCGPSEKVINEIVDDFYTKHVDDFCRGYGVLAHIKDEKISKHFIEKLSKMGFTVTKEHDCNFDNNYWLVKRDDTKHLEWCLENKCFNSDLVITLAYVNGDSYRMERIAENLAKDGYTITCSYEIANKNPITTFINEIKVNKK